MFHSHSSSLGEQQFKELYVQHHPMLFRVATYVVKDASIAEDIVQDTFLKIWKQAPRFNSIDNWASYLGMMVRNAAFDELRKQKKEENLVLRLKADHISEDEDEVFDDDFKKALELAVSKLPPKCRLIFSLSRFEGLSNDEIADYLDISKRTVETQISLALKAFRTDLRPVFEAFLPTLASGVITILLQAL